MQPRLSWLLGVVVLSLPACRHQDCDKIGHAALAVRVQDLSGAPVCDATVIVTDGDFSEELPAPGVSGDCVYYGAYERAGKYRIEASRRGASGVVEGIEADRAGGCDVLQTAQVSVALNT